MINRLVSVIVVTYNSSAFVIETLESVSKQTWKEIELIISDDCSGDSTIELCRKWLEKNRQRFKDAKILTFEKNTGVSANANRGLYAAKGDWIKFLGGDDTLKTNCIEDNMSWIIENPHIKVLFSYIEVYKESFDPQNLIVTTPGNAINSDFILASDRSANSQYKLLLVCDRIHFTPSVFIDRDTLVSVGGFDERFNLQEDYPLWLNLTRTGNKLYFMDKITVNYRRHSKAINNTGNNWLINPNYFKTEKLRRIYTYPYLPFDIRLNQRYIWCVSLIFRFSFINVNKGLNKFLLAILSSYLNPFKYFIYIRKMLNENLKKNEFYN